MLSFFGRRVAASLYAYKIQIQIIADKITMFPSKTNTDVVSPCSTTAAVPYEYQCSAIIGEG